MKEVTEWDNNPREMWVWNRDDASDKEKQKVIYICPEGILHFRVMAVINDMNYETYTHCAEIEESKTRRMTNQELAWWLREKPTREFSMGTGRIFFEYVYYERAADDPVSGNFKIREDGGEWKEPLLYQWEKVCHCKQVEE